MEGRVMFEHDRLKAMRQRHPDWIWNRSDTHAFVAVPGSHESFKTVVEPGNSFSPGPGTYGVSVWVHAEGQLHAPEEMPLEDLEWRFREGHLPVLEACWQAGPVAVHSGLFADGDVLLWDMKNYLRVALTNTGKESVCVSFYLVIRSFGAAGGPIHRLSFRENKVLINDAPVIYPDAPPSRFGALSYGETGQDISEYLRQDKMPEAQSVDDESTWASGALRYDISLASGEMKRLDFAFHLHAGHRMLDWLKAPDQPLNLEAKESDFLDRWGKQSSLRLDVPDRRFKDAFFCQLAHLNMYSVGDAPRISPVTYPLWWVRDGSYIVVALDKGGHHDFAERACLDAARVDAMTGFGGEADVPGELTWMLSEHYLLNGSLEYLKAVYPFLKRKADLLIRMRHADRPLRQPYEFVVREHALRPDGDLLCRPARDGLIIGRMDHHFPIYWVNAFAYIGLKRMALCARAMGEDDPLYEAEASSLKEAMLRHIPDSQTGFGQNERDTVAAFWPCGWADPSHPELRRRFDDWWNRNRCPDGHYRPEPLWTYFEVGQAHNYLLLGQRERVWQTLEHFLSHHSAPGLYTYPEGERDENSALLLWQQTRGWDRMRFVASNGWTLAELFLLLRDCLAREEGDALVIGSGVPRSWLNHPFSVTDMPTYFGKLSFRYDPQDKRLEVEVERMPPGGVRAEMGEEIEVRVAE